MNRELIEKALIDWNFWYKEQPVGVPRDYADQILRLIDSGLAITVLGVKRAGKSTIINQVAKKMIERGENPFNILIVNFEDSRFSEIREGKDLFSLYDLYKEIRKSNGKPLVILDEVQKVKGWEGFVRSLIDRKEARVIVSGSTSSVNNRNVRRVLAGRQLIFEVFPLSFKEFLDFKGVHVEREIDVVAREGEIKKAFSEYLTYGGFPLVVLNQDKERILTQLYEDILFRDVISECNIKKEEEVKSLSLFYISNIGNRINFRRLTKSLNIPLRTLQRYTECLKNAYLIFFVRALSPKLVEMVKSERKVYSIDHGLSSVVGYRLNESHGALFENLIFLELLRRYGENNIFYFRGKRGEVDFIIKIGNEVREAYQVTYKLNDVEREIKGLRELQRIKNVPSYIITFDEEDELDGIEVVKAWKWLLGKIQR